MPQLFAEEALMLLRLLLIILIIGLAGCGSDVFRSSPSSVVKNQIMTCNAGEYSKSESYVSDDGKSLLHGPMGQIVGGFKTLCDQTSRNGTIKNVEIKSEVVRGEGATVVYVIHYKDGSMTTADTLQLIKEKGDWKITIGGK